MEISRRRLLTGALAAAAATTATGSLTGCLSQSGGGGSTGEQFSGEVEWWTINLQKNYGSYIQGMIDAYTAEHPDVKINWVDVPGQDITTKLLAAIASGNVPDAVNYTSPTIGLFGDAMSDLTEFFSPEDLGAYVPSLVETLKSTDNRQVAVPWYNGGAGLGIYRKSVCEKAGYTKETLPTTYQEALELCQKVQTETGTYGANMLPYSQVVQGEGIALLNEDRTAPAFDTPETAKLLEQYKKFFDDKAIAPGALGKEPRQYEQSLENGKIAARPDSVSSALVNIEKNAPDIYGDLWITPGVTTPDGKNLFFAQQVFGIPSSSNNKAAAAEWLKFVTNAENQLAFCKLVSIFPSSASSLEDPFFTEIDPKTPMDEGRKILVDGFGAMEDAALRTGNDELLRQLFDEQVRAATTGSASASDALAAAAKQWTDELAKAK
ncbi:ABC transporter substrate-binding protein [Propionibacteriaceae bacterium Y1700]|uniref:ABC transporter substrate-binding protein n=1 Tax=Microlunatus sp. Y1700 TaxID=3418487 RepID=UPI003DA6D00E